MGAVEKVLRFVPGLNVETIESSCCGMAGAFGYEKANIEVVEENGGVIVVAQGP